MMHHSKFENFIQTRDLKQELVWHNYAYPLNCAMKAYNLTQLKHTQLGHMVCWGSCEQFANVFSTFPWSEMVFSYKKEASKTPLRPYCDEHNEHKPEFKSLFSGSTSNQTSLLMNLYSYSYDRIGKI